ncbi:MAG: Gfo/Idh/MocA family oxidoreductase [Akkermansiaceae bacterium]|jgi:predicted dehydrogenase
MDNNRRTILKTGTAATLAAAVPSILKAQNTPDQIKIGVIGCGGRGSGALAQAMSADPNVILWSIGDAFERGINNAVRVSGRFNERMQAPKERQFLGLDAYKGVIASGVDVVLLCTPPHFRPQHLRAAVEAGKHAFVEKPMAIDIPGVKSVIESAQMAKKKGTAIQHGFCWRYHPGTKQAYEKVLAGELGRVVSIYGTYMANPVAPLANGVNKPDGMGDVEFQMRHWQNYEWLCGTALVEQCIHTIDKVGWAMNDVAPIAAVANGGRAQRDDQSNLFDHYDITYEYPNGVTAHVGQRQMNGTHSDVTDRVYCENGTMFSPGRCSIKDVSGKTTWRIRPEKGVEDNMYQVCHNEFFAALRAGKIINTGEYMAKATALGLLGREAAHTGKRVKLEDYWKSEEDQAPDDIQFGDTFPVASLPIPGKERPATKPSRG